MFIDYDINIYDDKNDNKDWEDLLKMFHNIKESDGKIIDVQVLNKGYDYYSVPSIKVTGSGTGAKLTADTNGGTVRTITVNSGGTGYTSSGTKLRLVEDC